MPFAQRLPTGARLRLTERTPHPRIRRRGEYVDSNPVGFVNVLEGCRHGEVENLIFASSSAVYGANRKVPFETSDPTDHPVSLYGATRKSNEMLAHSYAELYDLPCTGLRFFTVYGPWGRPDMAYFLFTDLIVGGRSTCSATARRWI